MELTYEILEDGYLITGGNLRIKQTNTTPFSFPYPGVTIEESAQNHIAQILLDRKNTVPPSNPVDEQIQALNDKIDNAILEITTLIAIGGMPNV